MDEGSYRNPSDSQCHPSYSIYLRSERIVELRIRQSRLRTWRQWREIVSLGHGRGSQGSYAIVDWVLLLNYFAMQAASRFAVPDAAKIRLLAAVTFARSTTFRICQIVVSSMCEYIARYSSPGFISQLGVKRVDVSVSRTDKLGTSTIVCFRGA